MMRKIIRRLFFTFVLLFSIVSCSYQELGTFTVYNSTNKKVKNVEVYWENLDGKIDSIFIDEVPSKSYSNYYAAVFGDTNINKTGKEYEVHFWIQYEKDGYLFDVSDSITSVKDKSGNYFDSHALFYSDRTTVIEIKENNYRIIQEDDDDED